MKQIAKIFALGLSVTMSASVFTGCTQIADEDYSKKVVATYGDEDIYLDEANFNARYYQYMYEMYYSSYYGSDFWSTDIGTGSTMEDSVKESVMSEILQTRILLEHADEYKVTLSDGDKTKVTDAVTQFLDNYSENEKFIEKSGATKELVTKIYTNNAIANKVWQAVVADVDTEVSAKEARQVTVKYVLITEDNETYTDGETTAKEIASKVKKGTDIDKVCEDYDGLSASEGSYYKNSENDDELGNKAAELSTGDTITYQVEGTGWYTIYCVNDNDKDAAKTAKDDIISKRKDELFNKAYTDWSKKKFKVKDDVWAEVKLNGNTLYQAETESATENVSGSETSAENETINENIAASESSTESVTATE